MCAEVYKYTNGYGPQTLVNEFKPMTPRRTLRSNVKVVHEQTRTRTKFAENDPIYRGKKYWSCLPAEIQHSTSINMFKQRLKSEHHVFEHIT